MLKGNKTVDFRIAFHGGRKNHIKHELSGCYSKWTADSSIFLNTNISIYIKESRVSYKAEPIELKVGGEVA